MLGRFLNYLLVPLYTNLFLPDEYGIVTELYAYAAFLGVVLTYGMETAYFHFASRNKENSQVVYSTALGSIILSSMVFMAVLLVFIEPISRAMHYESRQTYLLLFAFILASDAITALPFAQLRLQNKALLFALLKLLSIALNIGLNLYFLLSLKHLPETFAWQSLLTQDGGVGYIFLANTIASIITLILIFIYAPARHLITTFDKAQLRQLLIYALPLLLAGIAGMVNETIDRILLRYLLPGSDQLSAIGIYGACYKISIIMTIFIQTFRYAAEPFFFSKAAEGDATKVYAKVMDVFVIVTAAIYCGTLLYMDWIQHFIGSDFRSGLHIVPILLMANWFLGIYYNLSVWYKVSAKTMAGATISVAGAIITLLFNVLLIPHMGYTGAAYTTLICYASMCAISYAWGQKHLRVNYSTLKILITLISAFLITTLFAHYKPQNALLTFLLAGLVLMLYITLLWRYLFQLPFSLKLKK
jgi:O-antigen/teichoic acid export membrane protein